MRDKGIWVIIYGVFFGLISLVLIAAASGFGQAPYGVDKFNVFSRLVWDASGLLGILGPLLGAIFCFIGGMMLIQFKAQGRLFSFLGVSLVMLTCLLSLIMSLTLSITNNYWELPSYLIQLCLLSLPIGTGIILIKTLISPLPRARA